MHDIKMRTLKILAEQTGVASRCIKDESELKKDLQCDSLDCIECMMALEEEFGIEIDEDKFNTLETVKQIIDYVTDVCTDNKAPPCQLCHPACNCREQLISTLVKAAENVIIELDDLKGSTKPLAQEAQERITQLVEQGHNALAALGVTYPLTDETPDTANRFAPDCSTACLVIE